MDQQSHNLKHVNLANLVAEAIDAEAAGVFTPTELDMAAVMDVQAGTRAVGSSQRSRRHALFARFVEKAMVGLPLAACVAIVVGIASMSVRLSPDSGSFVMLGSNGLDSKGLGAMQACDMQVFARCLTGPGQAVPADCGCVDLDDDGDVDLSDMGSYQQLASMSR